MPQAVDYEPPSLPQLLTIGSFIYLLNIFGWIFDAFTHAEVLGHVFLGIIFGPPLAGIIPSEWIKALTTLGYLGLTLIVFEGGLSTDLSLILPSLTLSIIVAATGVLLPIGLSILLITVGFKHDVIEGFSAGASLCSTSLGTTFAILSSHAAGGSGIDLRRTRVGAVLLSAAMADDVVGLVMAAIIPSISGGGTFLWQSVVRPVLVAIAYSIFIPVANMYALHPFYHKYLLPNITPRSDNVRHVVHLFILITVLASAVAGTYYAGTSELLGAYIAGCLLASLSQPPVPGVSSNIEPQRSRSLGHQNAIEPIPHAHEPEYLEIFTIYISPLLSRFLSPLFFASIGFAIPFVQLWRGSVLWRGIVYSLLMVIAKFAAGLWYLVFPTKPSIAMGMYEPSRKTGALFLGLALVARGEIALLVAALARPGLGDDIYLIIMWATLLCTIIGAVSVGALLAFWKSEMKTER